MTFLHSLDITYLSAIAGTLLATYAYFVLHDRARAAIFMAWTGIALAAIALREIRILAELVAVLATRGAL